MYRNLLTFLLCLFAFSIIGCFSFEHQYSVVPPGKWRAVLELHPSGIPVQTGTKSKDKVVQSIEEVTEGELPFNFEVIYNDESKFHIEIINGPERIKVEDITIWHDRPTNNDSILINFQYMVPILERPMKMIRLKETGMFLTEVIIIKSHFELGMVKDIVLLN